MSSATPEVANALVEWDAGERRLAEVSPVRDVRMRVVAAVEHELRRRVGSWYALADLVEAYGQSSGWFLEVAERTAPTVPAAWDASITLDAAFARWARGAFDSGTR
ncbi:MAG: hypothetical protein EXQ74_02205 [Thermoleophilia bacterium]|nr:hypothetical protein [Thermoleophilia bacterium]